MPVGGRINRRDNLRSKKALAKSNVPDKNKKQSNELNTGLNIIVESKNKRDNVKGIYDNKSEVIAKGFQNFYIRLEDLKLVETKEIFKNDNICLPGKGETKLSPIKALNKSPKKEEPKLTNDEIVFENLYDTLKRKGRHNKIKESELKLPVVDKNDNNADTLKRRGRKKKEDIEIEVSKEDENILSKQIVEATPKKRGRIAKKKDDVEVVGASEQEVIKEIEINNQKDENNTISKLTRRNAFQKLREEKIDAKVVVDKMDIDIELPENQEINESEKPSVSPIDPQEKPRVRASRIAKLVDTKDDTVEKENVVKETVARTGSRLSKNKPFVIESTDSNESGKMKIPGLVMLNNIKNRKSELKLTKENLSSINQEEKSKEIEKKPEESSNKSNAVDISGVNKHSNIQKSEISTKTTETYKEISPIKSVETLPEKSNISTLKKKGRVSKAKETAETNEECEKSNEIIPGLRMTADIKRRKSEMLGLTNEIVETEKKTNVRQSIRTNKVVGLATSENKSSKVEVESSRLRNSAMPSSKLASESHESKTDNSEKMTSAESPIMKTSVITKSAAHSVTSNQKPKEKILKGRPPMFSDKIPGLSTTSQLKKQKLESLVQKSATLDKNFKVNQKPDSSVKDSTTKPEFFSNLFEKESAKVDFPVISKSATLDSSSSIKFLSFKDQQKPPSGILSKPSPFKRPVSCLDQSDDELEIKCKQSRIQVENKRQSVTFNREVEVKEIHGNSFNSNTDDGGSGDEILDRLRDELERTKNRVVEKRVHNVNSSYSHSNDFFREKQRNIGPSMFGSADFSRKSSDLSNLISSRIKIQSNSPPRDQEMNRSRPQFHMPINNNDQSKSGALKKITPFSSTQKDSLSNWKSFKQNPPVQLNNKMDNAAVDETLNDDSMEIDKKPEESNKSTCLMM